MSTYVVTWIDVQGRDKKTQVEADSKSEAEDIVERQKSHPFTLPEERIDHIAGSVKIN
jgi:type II secretory pathway component PulF